MSQVPIVEFANAPNLRTELPQSHVQVNTVSDESDAAQATSATQLANIFTEGGEAYSKQLEQSKTLEREASISNARLQAGLQMQTIMEDAKKQTPDAQLAYFQENFQKYADTQLDGVTDEATKTGLMTTYNQFALAGQSQVFKNSIDVRNGLALSAFDKNAENYAKLAADAPNQGMRELYNSKVKEGFDNLVAGGALPADKAEVAYQNYRESVAVSMIRGNIDQGNTAMAAAQMKQVDSDLTLEKRTQLRDMLSNEQNRQANEAATNELKQNMRLIAANKEMAENPGDAAVKYFGADPTNPRSVYDNSQGRAVIPEGIAKNVAYQLNQETDPDKLAGAVTDLQAKYPGPMFDIAINQLTANGLHARVLGAANYKINNPNNGAAQQIESMMYASQNSKAIDEQFKSDKTKTPEAMMTIARTTMSDYVRSAIDSGKRDTAIESDVTNVVMAARGYMARNPNASASDAVSWAAKPYAIDPYQTIVSRDVTIQIPKQINGYHLDPDAIESGLDGYKIDPEKIAVPNTQYSSRTAENLKFVESQNGVRLVYKSPNGSVTQAYDASTKKPIMYDWYEAQKLGWDMQNGNAPAGKDALPGFGQWNFENPIISDRGM